MNNRDVFHIRKEAKELQGQTKINKLLEGIGITNNIFRNGEDDEWTKKAMAWVLIDLVKEYVSLDNINKAEQYYNQLLQIEFYEEDDIISKQIQILKPKIDVCYKEIKQADDLSKQEKHKEALVLMSQLIESGKLKPIHHESYGWIIYRYIKSEINTLDSVSVRRYLRDYMNLKNERPSMLHSMILNFGLNYSKEHSDFNLLNFFNLWGPEHLRYEDKVSSEYNGNNIPSLMSRICRELIEKDYTFDVPDFLTKIKLEKSSWDFNESRQFEGIDLFREPLFWKLYNYQKKDQWDELWKAFEFYCQNYSCNPSSEWHSKVLSLAERNMPETNSRRFFNFFRQWKPSLLSSNDWKDVEKDGKTYKSIGVKALNKAFKHLKTNQESEFGWLIEAYEKGIKECPENKWLRRELAILYEKYGKTEKAISLYKELAVELYDKPYYWNEFSKLVKDNGDLYLSMLSKVALIEKNDDFLGDVRLALAVAFEKKNLKNEAGIELKLYKDNREKNKWKKDAIFDELASRITLSEGNNIEKYIEFIGLAEEFAFHTLENEYAIVDYINREKKVIHAITFSNEEIFFKSNSQDFKINDLITGKKINKKEGDNNRIKLVNIKIESNQQPIYDIEPKIGIVYRVNHLKSLFHFLVNSKIDRIVKFNETKLRPKEGDFIEVRLLSKKDKKKGCICYKVITVAETDQTNDTLVVKNSIGEIKLKFKSCHGTREYYELDEEEKNSLSPDFAFMYDFYIPQFLLKKHGVKSNCYGKIKAINSGNKWKVFELTILKRGA